MHTHPPGIKCYLSAHMPAMTPHWMKATKNIQYYVVNIQKQGARF
mgnify:CR=1 FL=1